MTTFLILLALLAFALIVLEDVIHVNKAQSTLFLGSLAWLLLFLTRPGGLAQETVQEKLLENLTEIATLWLFLMAAMTFVAFLNHKGLITALIYRILPAQVSERKLLFIVALFAFVFSSLADNITATLVCVTLVLSLGLPAAKTIRFTVLVVFAVNSGGVSLITGDVTTLMIFVADKVHIQNLLLLSLPAFGAVMLLTWLLSRNSEAHITVPRGDSQYERDPVGVMIAALFLCTIVGTILLNVIAGVPPVLTFLFGLSVMFLMGRFLYPGDKRENLLDYIRVIEFDTLLFFLGILLLVGMLKEIGVLDSLTHLYDGMPALAANYVMGLLSALVDNVPLTAALLKADPTLSLADWLSLTYAVGVGGSLLIIGSAAGIVAMSKVEAVTFGSYLRYGAYLLAAYTVGYTGSYLIGLALVAV
ncbi:sodium:proton antiporter NhaD [Granulosicoccaceae sp. 1_MG-2023]|nr:sodium:proton antiporter NhaD [Granulosicoccaceae sp. 1_MG-2023]